MAEAKTKKLTHLNGVTVQVTAEKAERLVAGRNFSAATSKRSSDK